MIRTLCVIGLILAVLLPCCSQIPGRPLPGHLFELYSWPDSKGGWDFCLLPSLSGPMTSAEAVFNARNRLKGLRELERALAALPKGTEVLWDHGLVSQTGPGTRKVPRLQYPSADIIRQIRAYAKKHHVKIQPVVSALAAPR